MTDTSWTPARVELLKQLVAKGLSSRQIGREMNLGYGAISGKVSRMGLILDRSARSGKPQTVSVNETPVDLANQRLYPRTKVTSPKPLPSLTARPEEVSRDLVRIEGLTRHTCHWPIGNGWYCGDPVKAPRSSYCEFHSTLGTKVAA